MFQNGKISRIQKQNGFSLENCSLGIGVSIEKI